MKKTKENKAITLVALVITIIILLLLAGIAIASLGGENGIFAKVKQAKKAQIESEMKEQLTMGLQELQIAKQGNATLDDVTQDWANEAILSDYSPVLQEDASLNGKLIIMTKDNVKGKFLIGQNLDIETIEYNTSSVEIEYTTISRIDNKVKINIVVTDKINGVKQIEYPEGNPLKVVSGTKEQISIDYEVELGKEYKFVITTEDGNKTEKIIKIDDYYYNVTKDFGENVTIDNNATKAAYNKTYEATISTEGNYAITSLVVTMGGKTVTTSGNDIVDINTGKIKIETVTNDINIKVTTKKLVISVITPYIGASTTVTDSSKSVSDHSQEIRTTLYINFKATLEGKACTITLKDDTNKTVPYAITTNGKYIFIATGTYSEKIITKEIEVKVNKYKSVGGFVQYDAGNWTQAEIQELQGKNLYNINKEKTASNTSGLNFTFGGFTYEGDTANASDIASGNIITSRNQSVTPQSGYGTPKYSGWQILESKEENGKTYVTKITHAGSPENFVYYYTKDYDNRRAEYILSSGKRQTGYNTYQPRSWQMYVDQNQKDLIANTTDKDGNEIKDIHAMDYSEALAITGSEKSTTGIRNTGADYFLASAYKAYYDLWAVGYTGGMGNGSNCSWGVRPIVSLTSGVYIKAGTGTETDPYILGKD